jgi:hypothetical protein
MLPPPIDATRIVLQTLRALDDARVKAEAGWQRLTGSAKHSSPSDRRRPPQIW